MNVLETGSSGYISNEIKAILGDKGFFVTLLSLKNCIIEELDLSRYDAVIHASGIIKAKIYKDFLDVNVDLTKRVVRQVNKFPNIKTFIYISSMAIYGVALSMNKTKGVINQFTSISPNSFYGKSKYLGEIETQSIISAKVAIIRVPSVFSKSNPDYLQYYRRFFRRFPVLPKFPFTLKRSYINSYNLVELIRLVLISQTEGIYFPTDGTEYGFEEIIKSIVKSTGEKVFFSRVLGLLLIPFFWMKIIRNLFGQISYSPDLSNHYSGNYRIVGTGAVIDEIFGEQR